MEHVSRSISNFHTSFNGPLAEEDNGNDVTVSFVRERYTVYFHERFTTPKSAWLRTSVANCSITILKIHADGTVRTSLLGTGHFPQDKISYN